MSSAISSILGYATLLADIFILVLISIFFASHNLRRIIAKWAMPAAFAVALGGTVFSWIYSDIFHFVPCNLCWYQRVFLYPQPILLAVAYFLRDRNVMRYILWLSGLGMVVALWNHGIQMGWFGESSAVCGAGLSCAKRYVFELGYITIPMMSLTAFALNFLLALHSQKGEDIR